MSGIKCFVFFFLPSVACSLLIFYLFFVKQRENASDIKALKKLKILYHRLFNIKVFLFLQIVIFSYFLFFFFVRGYHHYKNKTKRFGADEQQEEKTTPKINITKLS